MRFRFPITGFPRRVSFHRREEKPKENSLNSLRERARFRFEGWLADDRVAVEHEFVLSVKDVRDVRFANEEPEQPVREPRVSVRDASRSASLAREARNGNARARINIRSSDGHFFEDGQTRGSTEPKWFAREDIPYGSMPADDAVWYPRLFELLDADDAKDVDLRAKPPRRPRRSRRRIRPRRRTERRGGEPKKPSQPRTNAPRGVSRLTRRARCGATGKCASSPPTRRCDARRAKCSPRRTKCSGVSSRRNRRVASGRRRGEVSADPRRRRAPEFFLRRAG